MPLGCAVVAFEMIAVSALGWRGVDIGILLAFAAVPHGSNAVHGLWGESLRNHGYEESSWVELKEMGV